jgi:hypothetical protein
VALRTCVSICLFYGVSLARMNMGAFLNMCFYAPILSLEQCLQFLPLSIGLFPCTFVLETYILLLPISCYMQWPHEATEAHEFEGQHAYFDRTYHSVSERRYDCSCCILINLYFLNALYATWL